MALAPPATACSAQPFAALPICSNCAASPELSRAWVERHDGGGARLVVHSVSSDCRAKATGGDAWVVRFVTRTSTWRELARDLKNGTYVAHVPPDELSVHDVTAHAELWYTTRDPHYLETQWVVNASRGTFGNSQLAFGSLSGESAMQCVAGNVPSVRIEAASSTKGRGPASRSSCPPGELSGAHQRGRFVRTNECATLGLGDCGTGGGAAAKMAEAHSWVPTGCAMQPRCPPDVRRCLGGRRLLIIGDSISNGFALDVCERLNGTCVGYQGPPAPLPDAEIIISNHIGYPPRVGLANLVQDHTFPQWAAVLKGFNNGVVVLNSGAHDVAFDPFRWKATPLTAYRSNLRALAKLVEQAANTTTRFVWRQTTHQILIDTPPGTPQTAKLRGYHCAFRAYPGTHPLVISAENDAARAIFGPLGVRVWEEPAALTLSAPFGCWKDAQHHDICGAGGDRYRGEWAANCARERRAGTHERNGHHHVHVSGNVTWHQMGGLSEAITDTFFTSVLGCSSCAPTPRTVRR